MTKQKIAYVVKHNPFIQKVFTIFFNTAFGFLGLFVKYEPNLIMFISLMGSGYNDSPRSIYEYIKSHKKYDKYNCLWAFEKPSDYPGIPSIKIDSPKYFIYLLKAGYWVSNTNIQRGLSFKKKRTRWIYTCHGTAIKLVGNDCPGRNDFDYSKVNIICVQSAFDEEVMKSGFNAREESFLECGRPISDQLFLADESDYVKMRKKIGIPQNKTVILYAPTWRDSSDGGTTYAIKPPVDFTRWEKELGDEYIVLFRAHHITTRVLNVQFNSFVWDVSKYPEINELMIASDILISDYSAVLTDFSILKKPILCFAYDYDEYLKKRGTYFELDNELPSKSCRDESELIERIKSIDYEEECIKSDIFRKKFVEFGGNATELAVRALFEERENN